MSPDELIEARAAAEAAAWWQLPDDEGRSLTVHPLPLNDTDFVGFIRGSRFLEPAQKSRKPYGTVYDRAQGGYVGGVKHTEAE